MPTPLAMAHDRNFVSRSRNDLQIHRLDEHNYGYPAGWSVYCHGVGLAKALDQSPHHGPFRMPHVVRPFSPLSWRLAV